MTPPDELHREFLRLYTPTQNSLFRYICSQHPNISEAEDILQDVVTVAWEKFESFNSEDSKFTAWLITIARNKILHSKRQFLRKRKFLDKSQDGLAEDYFTPYDFSKYEEKEEALSSCLAELSEDHKSLLQMRYYEKYSCLDLATHFKRSHNQVRTQLHRLRSALKTCINQSRFT
ncbi:MAG: sigma-70 family RNA polymerase sigma factor [Lentisphaeraceae bacterium]|nr:sigma-70 family RNA polymerase sigma factor [Lentisphaeraceae bacterium]